MKSKRPKKRKAYFKPIVEELKNGGSEALLGLLLNRDIRHFNAEAIPETYERCQQKLNSASPGDKLIIEFAQDACLPGAVRNRPWIARAHGDQRLAKPLQTPGLYDVMRARGGTKLAHMSDTSLSDILKEWGFKKKSLGNSRAWEAPLLLDLRKSIRYKFRAVEFDNRLEWAADDEQGYDQGRETSGNTATTQSAEDVGEPDDADLALDEIARRCEQEKHDLDDEAASFSVRPSKTRGRGRPTNPMVDPTTGMPSAAAVSAFVKASRRRL